MKQDGAWNLGSHRTIAHGSVLGKDSDAMPLSFIPEVMKCGSLNYRPVRAI